MKIVKYFSTLLVILLICSSVTFPQQVTQTSSNLNSSDYIEFHVAPSGNDMNKGAISEPFASINAARDALRKSGEMGKKICSVIIHTGTYRLTEPIVFGPEDGGREDAPVSYRAAGDGKVIITGAQVLSSTWRLWKNGIYRTRIRQTKPIDQLFVNNQRQHLARYPDFGAGFVSVDNDKSHRGNVAGFAPYEGCTPDAWDSGKVSEWKDPTGAFMHGMHYGLWGSMHFRVLGKNKDGSLRYEGGWQNNRNSRAHNGYRMIENVFEELDAPGEWFHDTKKGWLYYKPARDVDMSKARFEVVGQLKHLIEIYGEFKMPIATMDILNSGNGLTKTVVKIHETIRSVKFLNIEGICFTGTARTFMETKEPLLRSDWTIYRGGAIHLRGTEDISIVNSDFEELGGNGVFVDGYNRRVKICSNRFNSNGATDVNFVGSFSAPRDPAFSYGQKQRQLDRVDTEIGPLTDEYPADCLVEDNLMTRCGRFEKQTSGINISMSSRISVRHNTISHTPRAAINICDGTWGGHIIEWNDCFETVLETSDHGSFNSWGRDRYWHPAGLSGPRKNADGKPLISFWIEEYPACPYWDAYQTTILRNNRMRCDHGWDIDLDDGSSNYEIYNNLCLGGGLKTREGYGRIVTNNIILGDGFDCRVPYPKPVDDIFMKNILWGKSYRASSSVLWGGVRNANFYHNPDVKSLAFAINMQGISEDDGLSLYGDANFVNPGQGDFTVTKNSPALRVGFKNFNMEGYGVKSSRLKTLADTPGIYLPQNVEQNVLPVYKTTSVLGAEGRALRTKTDLSATGMFDLTGFMLLKVPVNSKMALLGFEVDDVILEINGKIIHDGNSFKQFMDNLAPGTYKTNIMRVQQEHTINFELR